MSSVKGGMVSAETARPLWPFFAALCLAALALNWVWEMAQMPAYAEVAGRPWRETLLPCTWASLGDVAATLAVYAVGALAAGQRRWGGLRPVERLRGGGAARRGVRREF